MPSFKLDRFPEPRPRYTDRIAFAALPGTLDALRRAAEVKGKPLPDFLREAIQRATADDTTPASAIPSDGRGAA